MQSNWNLSKWDEFLLLLKKFFLKKKSTTNQLETIAMQILFLYDTRMVSSEFSRYRIFEKT